LTHVSRSVREGEAVVRMELFSPSGHRLTPADWLQSDDSRGFLAGALWACEQLIEACLAERTRLGLVEQ
jgi:hypothetical protein